MSFLGRLSLPLPLLLAAFLAGVAPSITGIGVGAGPGKSPSRRLTEKFEYTTDSYYDSRTGTLRRFMEELLSSQSKGDPNIQITSAMDADGTFTTGSADRIASMDQLLPFIDPVNINMRVQEATRDFHTNLKHFLDLLSPDPFSENPPIFLGENAVYYTLTKKRGLLFYYLSRIIIYAVLGFLLLNYVFADRRAKTTELEADDMNHSRPKTLFAQILLFTGAFVLFFMFASTFFHSRGLVTEAMFDLMYRFRDIGTAISSILASNREINSLKVRVPGDSNGRFFIQTPIAEAAALAAKDVRSVDRFINNFAPAQTFLGFAGPLLLFAFMISGFVLDRMGSRKLRMRSQMGVFLCVSGALFVNLVLLEREVTNLSTTNDFCLNLGRYGSLPIFPYQGIGIPTLLGCSVDNHVFQQLYVNIIAQNAAIKVFNNEMFSIGREKVHSTDEALEVIAFLQRLDSSNPTIDRLSSLLVKNTQVIIDLLKINGCNPIKTWIGQAQRDVCLTSSHLATTGFTLLLVLAGVLLALLFVSIVGYMMIVRHKTGSKVRRIVLATENHPNKVVLPE